MQIYYHDNKPDDPRLPHTTTPPLPTTHLATLGITHHTFPPSLPTSPAQLETLAQTRSYANRDEITISPAALGGAATFEQKLKLFYEEHMHEDEEIRYVLEGGGYFDVRDEEDRWVRVAAGVGDLLVLPAGIWHRFVVDGGNYIKAMRLFQTQPKWAALNRTEELEKNEVRKSYVNARAKGFVTG